VSVSVKWEVEEWRRWTDLWKRYIALRPQRVNGAAVAEHHHHVMNVVVADIVLRVPA
jgi:hypothetical protein